MNKNELAAEMVRHGDTTQSMAEFLGISRAAYSAKINGQKDFKLGEVVAIIKRYKLSPKEYDHIFFNC